MKNKNGFDLGEGQCPMPCNDGVACDWLWYWKECPVYKTEWFICIDCANKDFCEIYQRLDPNTLKNCDRYKSK